MPWQRLLSLQVLRWLMSDPQLVYSLFTAYDMSIHHDVNAVHDTLQVALEIVKVRQPSVDFWFDRLLVWIWACALCLVSAGGICEADSHGDIKGQRQ
jgi:hypothetical protein